MTLTLFHCSNATLFCIISSVLEKVNFESKFDKLPEFHPENADNSIPQSPGMLLAMRKRKGLESPATPLRSAAAADSR